MKGDVVDDASRVVEWEMSVERVGQDSISGVGDEEKDEDDCGEAQDLDEVALLTGNVSCL